jgi:hypothetical protein
MILTFNHFQYSYLITFLTFQAWWYNYIIILFYYIFNIKYNNFSSGLFKNIIIKSKIHYNRLIYVNLFNKLYI